MFPSCPSPDPINEKQDFWKMALIIETIGNLIKRGYMLLVYSVLGRLFQKKKKQKKKTGKILRRWPSTFFWPCYEFLI